MAAHDIGFNQHLGAVTDGGDGLARFKKCFYEFHGGRFTAQMVRVDHPSGKHEGVKIFRPGLVQRQIHRDGFAPVRMVPSLDFICGG